MKYHIPRICRRLVSIALLAISSCLSFTPALACSCYWPPEVGFVGQETSRLPANAEGIAWYVSKWWKDHRGESVSGDRFTLEIFEGGTFYELAARVSHAEDFATPKGDFLVYLIAPGEGLTPGATYRVTDNLATMVRGERVERRMVVTIDPEILSTHTPFTLDIGPPNFKMIWLAAAASCSSAHEVSEVWITSRLSPVAHAWRDQLLYRTIVDGKPWQPRSSICSRVEPGKSWDGVGSDRIFTACGARDDRDHDATPVATESQRTVVMEAHLPGTDIVLRTPLKHVDLDCSGLVERS